MAELFKNKYRIDSCRLKNWDYSSDGYYFITICTRDRIHFFGQVKNYKMYLSDMGKIAVNYWREIPKHFPFVVLDEYIVMPNHIHGILIINNNDSRTNRDEHINGDERVRRDVAAQRLYGGECHQMSKISPKPGSLPVIVGSFKSACTKKIRKNITCEFEWQPRFYDHIIRDDEALYNIRQYIITNPKKWWCDRNNLPGLYM